MDLARQRWEQGEEIEERRGGHRQNNRRERRRKRGRREVAEDEYGDGWVGGLWKGWKECVENTRRKHGG